MTVSAQQQAAPPAATASSSAVPAPSAPVAVPTVSQPLQGTAQQPIAVVVQQMPPAAVPWPAYVTPGIAFVAVCAATWVGVQNWKTAKQKIKVDLFEKRMKIYDRLHELIEITTAIAPDLDESKIDVAKTYIHIALEARWLLDKNVLTWMHENIELGILRYGDAEEEYNLGRMASVGELEDEQRRLKLKQCRSDLNLAQHKMLDVFTPYLALYKQ